MHPGTWLVLLGIDHPSEGLSSGGSPSSPGRLRLSGDEDRVCLSARSASGCEQRRATKPTACGISRRSDAEANALRASKTKDAVRLRGNALLVFNRAKKKLKKSAVDNAAGEPS